MQKKVVSIILSIICGVCIFLGSSNTSVYASLEGTQGNNIVSRELKHNKGEKGDSYEDLSEAHKEQSKKNEKEKDDVSKEQAASWLQTHNKWVQFASFMTWLGHQIGWFGIKAVYFVSSYIEGALMSILDFISELFGGEIVNDVLSGFPGGATALAWTILATAIAFFGVRYIIKGEKLDLKNTMTNVILIAVFLVSSSTIINKFVDAGVSTFESARTEVSGEKGSFSLQVIKDNVVDLKKAIDKNDESVLSNENGKGSNNLTDDFLKSADMAQILKPDDDKKISKYLEYQVFDVNDKGQIIAGKIDNGWFSIFKSGYFRFGTQFFNIFSGLAIMAVALALYGYLLLRNAIDLIFTKLVGGIASAMDIEKGTKLKTVLMEIAKSTMGFAFTGISLCVFMRLFTTINSQSWNPVAKAIALIATTIACLDGAKIFDRLFGIDLGVRSGWEATVGAFTGAKMASSVVSSAGQAVASGAGAVYQGTKSITNGVMDSIKEHDSKQNNNIQNNNNDTNSHSNNRDIGPTLNNHDVEAGNRDLQTDHNIQNSSGDINEESMNDTQVSNDSSLSGVESSSIAGGQDASGSVSVESGDENIESSVESGDSEQMMTNDVDASVGDSSLDAEQNESMNQESNNSSNIDTQSAVEGANIDASAEDNDNNMLNESSVEQSTINDQSDISQQESVYSNGVIEESGGYDSSTQEVTSELSSDIEGLEAKVNDTYTPEATDSFNNGVGLSSTEYGMENNDFDGSNGLQSSFDMPSDGSIHDSIDSDSGIAGQSLGVQSKDDSFLSENNHYSSNIHQNTNSYQAPILNDNSQSHMSQLSQQASNLGVQNQSTPSFDPTRRSSQSDQSSIKMPEVNTSGAKEPFDHTK